MTFAQADHHGIEASRKEWCKLLNLCTVQINGGKTARLKHVHYPSVAKSRVRVRRNMSKLVNIVLCKSYGCDVGFNIQPFRIPQVPLWDHLPGRLRHSPSTGPVDFKNAALQQWKRIIYLDWIPWYFLHDLDLKYMAMTFFQVLNDIKRAPPSHFV